MRKILNFDENDSGDTQGMKICLKKMLPNNGVLPLFVETTSLTSEIDIQRIWKLKWILYGYLIGRGHKNLRSGIHLNNVIPVGESFVYGLRVNSKAQNAQRQVHDATAL